MVLGYNFTADVRVTLARAREEARRLGHGYVGTEHLALAILTHPSKTAVPFIASLDRAKVIAELEERAGPGEPQAASHVDLPYTSRAKRVIELTMHETSDLRHKVIDVEHLLLGLLREDVGIGGKVLREAGLDLDAARALIRTR